MNSGNLIHHRGMNWGKFKDPVCYLFLAGAVVASGSLVQEVAGLNFFKCNCNLCY